MSELAVQTLPFPWLVDGPLALEAYVEAVESRQARLLLVNDVLSQMRQRLDVPPPKESPPSAKEIRALFARYRQTLLVPPKTISQLVVEMREE